MKKRRAQGRQRWRKMTNTGSLSTKKQAWAQTKINNRIAPDSVQ